MSGPKTEEQISAAEKKKDDAGKKACRRASNPAEDFSPRAKSPQRRTRMLGGVLHAFDIEDRGFITKADWLELSNARRVLRQKVRSSARISVLYTHRRTLSLDSGKWAAPLAHPRQSEGLSPPHRGRGQAVVPGDQSL